jgi:lysophospholipid acyltransferase (LPLAT)-like uncharacterized protein
MRIRVPPAVVRHGAVPLLALAAATWRVERRHRERWDACLARTGPRLFLLWHEALLPLLWCHRGLSIAIVVSEAREGRYLRDFATRLGYVPIAGSSRRGAVKAMRGALRALADGALLAVTPDGPIGPRRVIKPGALAAAGITGASVHTVHAVARPAVRLRSWDRFMIPLPGARVRVAYGPPFRIEPGPDSVAEAAARAAADLDALEQEIAWPGETPVTA